MPEPHVPHLCVHCHVCHCRNHRCRCSHYGHAAMPLPLLPPPTTSAALPPCRHFHICRQCYHCHPAIAAVKAVSNVSLLAASHCHCRRCRRPCVFCFCGYYWLCCLSHCYHRFFRFLVPPLPHSPLLLPSPPSPPWLLGPRAAVPVAVGSVGGHCHHGCWVHGCPRRRRPAW